MVPISIILEVTIPSNGDLIIPDSMLFAARFVFIEVSDFFELISEVFALISASLLVLSFLTNSIFFKTSHSQIRDKLS
ncbi:TPA: hypothetical protein DEG21_04090 [Patescibacteria group bacterium]|nr:hypothetical protein [Candidatus Gracilibacteria bacterium]